MAFIRLRLILLLLDIHHHIHSGLVSSTFKFGGKEDIRDLRCKTNTGHKRAHAKHVGIVVQTCKLCAIAITAKRCANTLMLICRNTHTDTGGAKQNSIPDLSALNARADLLRVNGIMNRCLRIGSHVDLLNARLVKMLFQDLLEIISTVITSDCNFHFYYRTLYYLFFDVPSFKQASIPIALCKLFLSLAFCLRGSEIDGR